MVQLNLLPDVKLEFIRTQKRKRTVIGVAIIASAASLFIFFALLSFVRVAQPAHMKALDKDIDAAVVQLKENQELDKILTVQNQLASLPALHDDKKISSRLLTYLTQLTPNQATISDVTLDFEANTLSLKGNADALRTVNKFTDTLKFTDYKVEGEAPAQGKAFSNVVLSSFNVGTDNKVSYEITLNFEPAIFANSAPNTEGKSPVSLQVPKIISTRSATQTPNSLFAPQPESEEE